LTPIFQGSLRRKLLSVMLLTTLVALVVALGAMIAYDLSAYHRSWTSDVSGQAALIGRTTAPALEFDDVRMAGENLALLRLQPKVRAAAIYGPRGQVFATYAAPGVAPDFPPAPGADGVRTEADNVLVFKRIVANGQVGQAGQVLGTVYLRAQYELYDRILSYAGIAAVVALLAMAVAWLVSNRLQRVITQPILAMGAAAREVVEQRDYSRRVGKTGDDEVGALVDAFNEMMGEIEQRTQALEASNIEKAREVDDRRLAQQEVMRLNEELERRVQQRTAQLERSNADLVVASHAADQANRAKSEFLSNMSHELRTPLNAIIGFGQLLARADPRTSTPERNKTFVGHIVEAGHHLLTLINDILNLAQIEAGRLSLSVESVLLADVLAECRTLTESMAAQRNIRLLFSSTDDLLVKADRTRLKQVLLNLVSNAIKYNREMGSVAVDTLRSGPELIRISVQDTGLGMRPDQVEALFQPFNRLGQETGVQEGTGIGLVVTKRLVELMGGSIGVSSTPGSGSVFWIELQAGEPMLVQRAAALAAAAGEAAVAATGPRITVLCVEDNPASLKLIQEVMATRPSVRLLTAGNGRIGVEMAREHRPDLILMDNNMPVLTGREAQVILRDDPKTAGIPIIAISANAMPGAVAAGLEAGFFRYLTKPIEVGGLIEAVDSALELVAKRKGSAP